MLPGGGEEGNDRWAAMKQHLYVYVNERRRRGEFTAGTADAVWYGLMDFVKWYGNRPIERLSPRHIEQWLETHADWGQGTRATRFTQLRAFCRWLVNRGIITKDPFRDLPSPKRPRKVPRPLTRDQYDQLVGSLYDTRGRLIVALMYWLGLRCIEVSNLNIEDVDRYNKTITVVGKGGHERRLPLVPQVELAINGYLRTRRAATGPLVASYSHPGRIGAKHISALVRGWLIDAGLKDRAFDRVTAHAMRHSAATELAEATNDPYLVQELLGHADISTSMYYVKRAQTTRLREALELRDRPVAT